MNHSAKPGTATNQILGKNPKSVQKWKNLRTLLSDLIGERKFLEKNSWISGCCGDKEQTGVQILVFYENGTNFKKTVLLKMKTKK